MSGTTDAQGTFRYAPGETVSFTLGALALDEASGAAQITLFNLAGISEPPADQAEFETLRYLNDRPGPLHRVITYGRDRRPTDAAAQQPYPWTLNYNLKISSINSREYARTPKVLF